MEESNYEKNLLLNYNAIAKDIEMIITSVIPTQKNLIQMFLWLNTTLIGAMFVMYDKYGVFIAVKGTMIVSFSFSSFAAAIAIGALSGGKMKSFTHIPLTLMPELSGKYEHIHGLNKMTEAAMDSYHKNSDIVSNRAKSLSWALWFTKASAIFLLIAMVLILNLGRKEVKKVADKNETSQTEQRPVAMQSGGQQAKAMLQTNSYDRAFEFNDSLIINKQYTISAEDRKPSNDKIEKKK